MRWMILLSVVAVLAGCGASFVTNSDILGGEQKGPRWGLIKYLNQGADSVIEHRQKSARSMMEDFCSPKQHKVVETSENSGSTSFFLYQGIGGGGSQSYVYIKFECAGILTESQQREISVRKEKEKQNKSVCDYDHIDYDLMKCRGLTK